ncbi:MAG: cation transporter [Eubacteriales bacterium]|nr:cation transporter [Eubacteriales bacterium]
MTTLKVEGMMCEGCVKRVTNALTELGLDANVSLAEKTVSYESDAVETAKVQEAIEDLGFSVVG